MMQSATCGWRIVISPMIPQDSPSCYDSWMRNLAVLFIHFIAVLARLLGPGGVRSIVAESLLLKHQLLLLNRSRQRSPNLSAWDRILAGWMALLLRPTRLLRSAIVLKPMASQSADTGVDGNQVHPYVPLSHPFVERLIDTLRREYLEGLTGQPAMGSRSARILRMPGISSPLLGAKDPADLIYHQCSQSNDSGSGRGRVV
jgi:hypothetical protein